MAQRTDRNSLRRPLLLGAVMFLFLFVATGAVVSQVGGEKVAETARRDQLTQAEATARRQSIGAAGHVADELLVVVEPARRAAESIARESMRDRYDALPASAGVPEPESLPGTERQWLRRAEGDVFAIAAEDADLAELCAWADALAPVLRSSLDPEAGITRTSVVIDRVGIVGSPVAWALSAAKDADVAGAIERAVRGADAPQSAGWSADGDGALVYAAPVVGADGVRIGTSLVEFATASLIARLDAAASTPDRGAVLVSSNGRVLAASGGFDFAVGAGAPGADLDTALHPFVGAVGVFYPPQNGHHVVASGRRFAAVGLKGTPFSVGLVGPAALPEFEESAAVGAARRLGLAVLGLCLLFGVATLMGAYHVAGLHRARMRHVLDGIEAHERADYAFGVDVQGDDDVGEVARWMNTAAARLRQGAMRVEETEHRLNGLIDSIGDGFVTTDADDRIVHVNQRFADLLRRPAASIEGRYVEELLVPESIERFHANVGGRRERKPAQFEVVWNASRTPHPRTILSCVPIFDDGGRPCGGWIVATDLTDKVRVHEEIASAEKIRALGEMAGGVAHDFNNVLTVVLGNAQYLLLDELAEEQRDTLRTIERAALDGTETVRRIREFTRTRTVAVNAEFVDPSGIVDEVMCAARRRLEVEGRARGVEYKVAVERRSRRRVRGNAAELHEALANIVENALEAMPKGGTLTVETFDRGEDAIAIRVEDTGVGIAPEARKKIFDPFFTTKETGRCPGLGLSIAFGIIRAHRGRIDVKSELGAGSTFTVLLQAASKADDGRAQPPSTGSTHIAPRVLVVGGESVETNRLVADVRGLGVYATAVHATSAHALVSDPNIFNTLVVEFDLGAASGWELARQARASRADLRIILITTPAHPVSETQARNAGIDLVLVTPFDARDLHAELFALLAAPRTENEAPLPASARARRQTPRTRDEADQTRTSEVWTSGQVRAPDDAPRAVVTHPVPDSAPGRTPRDGSKHVPAAPPGALAAEPGGPQSP